MVAYLKLITVVIIYLAVSRNCYSARVHFTNFVCNITDPKYARLDRCRLKAVSRDVQYFTAKVTVFELPITDFTLRIQFMKRLNGWKPFLYDRTIRCNFTRNMDKLTRMVWNVIRNMTNIKHDCPLNQTIEIPRLENVYVNDVIKFLPVPTGVYGAFITAKTNNITRGLARFQVEIE